MSMHTNLRNYIQKVSKGLLVLNKESLEEIERIVKAPRAYAKLSRYNAQFENYDHLYTETLSDEEIIRIYEVMSIRRQVEKFYLWELYSSDGNKIGELHNCCNSVHQLKTL